jgi:uncharacterized membrane-anchored protein YitT (DUF2179 family)
MCMIKKVSLKDIVLNLALITAGGFIGAAAINGILLPNHFLAGGIGGLGLALHYLFPSIPVGAAVFVLNIPLFVVGWMFVGRRFFLFSLAGMTVFSLALFLPIPPLPLKEPLLKALTAGIISGIGGGIILRSLGSGGGLDILSVILLKRFSIRIGTTFMAFNSLLMLLSLLWFDLEIVLFTIIYIFTASHLLNLVVTGFNQRKSVMVVSTNADSIAKTIMEATHRGVTVVNGEGGYTGKKLRILYTVITFRELARFKAMVRRLDPDAFVVVAETVEVMGGGIGNQPHW